MIRLSRGLRIVTAATLATAAGAVVVTSVGSASASQAEHPTTLQFRTVLALRTVNSAGAGGPGDVLALRFDLSWPSGASAGTADISCTITTPDTELCHAAFVLQAGQIDAQASIPLATDTFDAAIVGGFGRYQGVTGHIHNVVTAPGVIERTFYLTSPEGD